MTGSMQRNEAVPDEPQDDEEEGELTDDEDQDFTPGAVHTMPRVKNLPRINIGRSFVRSGYCRPGGGRVGQTLERR